MSSMDPTKPSTWIISLNPHNCPLRQLVLSSPLPNKESCSQKGKEPDQMKFELEPPDSIIILALLLKK